MSTLQIEPVGPSWRVTIGSASFLFRDVQTDKEMSADVEVRKDGRRLFRSTSTLSLTGRDRLARTAWRMDKGSTEEDWRKATFAAAEAVMEAIEQLAAQKDLRASTLHADSPAWTARPFWPDTTGFLIMPGEGGKSTLLRAIAVSIVTGREIVPGIVPQVTGPVVYVVSEAPSERAHARSIESICRGAGLERGTLPHRIGFIPAKGRPLHRLSRSLAEQAHDAAGVIFDAQQGLLGIGEGNVRDQAAMFWNAIEELNRPAFVISHPNLEQSRNWDRSDGRAAGSEVNRDRPRISWAGHFVDEPAVAGGSYRRTTLTCTKYNEGPRPAPISFGVGWQFPTNEADSGMVTFTACDLVEHGRAESARVTAAIQETIDAYGAGATTPTKLAAVLGCSINTAKVRLYRMRDYQESTDD